MCWVAHYDEDKKEYTAKDNIPVTKLVLTDSSNNIFSFYKYFNYKLNNTYKISNFGSDKVYNDAKDCFCIFYGFHSYTTKLKFYIFRSFFNPMTVDIKHNGEVLSRLDAKLWFLDTAEPLYLTVADCIIPKGARYFLNNRGEYVSSAIRIINTYKIK